MPGKRTFETFPSLALMSERAAGVVRDTAAAALREKGSLTLAVSGGTTPLAMFRMLSDKAAFPVAWNAVHVFWVDERAAPPDAPDSNFLAAKGALLSKAGVPSANIHRIRGEFPPLTAASLYEEELEKFFGPGVPAFDLMIMGMGPDGHTASLFPFSSALEEKSRRAVCVPPPTTAKPSVERVTLTYPVINNARSILFLTSGADKRGLAEAIASGAETDFQKYPAAGVRADGPLLWLHSDNN